MNTSKLIFIVKRTQKVFPKKILVDNNLFLHLHFNTLNNNFTIKNDEISYFKNSNHASHLKQLFSGGLCEDLKNIAKQ